MVRCFRIEIAGRLVGEQKPRHVGDRARDRDALLLAAGKLGRPVRQPLGQAKIGQQLAGALVRLALARRPRIICGSMTFSTAENSGSR